MKNLTKLILCIIFVTFVFCSPAFAEKIDPIEFAKKLGFSDSSSMREFTSRIPTGPARWNEKEYLDENLFNQVKELHEKLKDINRNDFKWAPDKLATMIGRIMDLKYAAGVYLQNRPEALAWIERSRKRKEEEKRREEERAREEIERQRQAKLAQDKEKKDAPQQIIAQYRNSPKPQNFDQIKKLISLLPKWRITVSKVYSRQEDKHYWNIYSAFISSTETPDTSTIFNNIPIDPKPYQDKYILLEAFIVKQLNGLYVIKNGGLARSGQALAEIPKDLIRKSGITYDQTVYMICRLVDVIKAQTVLGNIIQVAKVKVEGIIPVKDYNGFREYVLGHPEDFPQDKYLNIILS